MIRITELRLPLEHTEAELRAAVVARLQVRDAQLESFTVFRRAVDARRRSAPVFAYTIDCGLSNEAQVLARDPRLKPAPDTAYRLIARAPADVRVDEAVRPLVVGFGPCGIFAALVLAQMGLRPIVLERGRRVRERTRDTWGLWRKGVLDPDSNVQFGEGGAGTFSDGKLWSQISDPRHLTRKVLDEFVKAGAPEEILYESKPHIGTFRLVSMVERMRAQIEGLGGEICFRHRLIDVGIERGVLRSVTIAHPGAPDGEQWPAEHVVLAPGHSARETFAMLYRRGVFMEAKPFSVGFRVEHPQGLIDRARYGRFAGHRLLGAADYRLVHHARNGRAVYSFCMCPGGTVVAATSEPGHVVTNGMSQYSRAERNANAGIVVGIAPEDYVQRADETHGRPVHPLDGVEFQRLWERCAYELGGGNYHAPGQLVGDFLKGQPSSAPGSVLPSYRPGVRLTDLAQPGRACLPDYAIEAIREAIPAFDKQIAGFAMHDAVFTGVETRTSSPLRITRNDSMRSVNVRGLYPAGEGAGYAGGIMSAAVDGIEVAEAVARAALGLAPAAPVRVAG
ncbi:MAG TPA: hypothetical protein VMK32_07710 [Burkholderiaceae bacterium]|nr:hypothetical protein [Burkholderiaceae bacterium]